MEEKNKLLPVFFGLIALLLIIFFGFRENNPTGHVTSEGLSAFIQIEPEYARIEPGGSILAQLSLVQPGNEIRRDVMIEHYLEDVNGGIIFLGRQTLAVETRTTIILSGRIPQETPQGDYKLTADVTGVGSEVILAKASQRVIIAEDVLFSPDSAPLLYKVGFFAVIIALIILFIILYLTHLSPVK